jgi:hypothetical protein
MTGAICAMERPPLVTRPEIDEAAVAVGFLRVEGLAWPARDRRMAFSPENQVRQGQVKAIGGATD